MTLKPAVALVPFFMATSALADVPVVVTDFAPVEAIVARVMKDVGEPTSILSPGEDPHHFAMRPSHARLLSGADLVIWTGAALTPWLEAPIDNLSDGSLTLELLETDGWTRLALRGEHSHEHDDHGHEDHDHEKAKDDDHDHDDHGDDEHDHEEADHDDHGHDDHGEDSADLGIDPHAWLSPAVAAAWAGHVAETLAAIDPENASTYTINAGAFAGEMTLLIDEVAKTLDDVDGETLIFPHDATQYFEAVYGFAPFDYIAANDAADAGPAHLRELREAVESGAVVCVFSDAETNPGTVNTLIEGTDAGTANLDLTNAAGSDYPTMIRALATAIASCGS